MSVRYPRAGMEKATTGDVYDFSVLDRRLATVVSRTEDLTEFWPTLGDWWHERQMGVFRTRGRGKLWAPLARSTLMKRRQEGVPGAAPLIRTGRLRAGTARKTPIKTTPTYAVFGTKEDPSGGKYQTQGHRLPIRNPVPNFSIQERKHVVDEMGEWIMKRRGGA